MGISGQINLMGFNNSFTETRKDKNGNPVECAVIPLPHNWLSKTEKGNVFVNISAFEIDPAKRKADRKDTHILKLDPGKEIREKLKAVDKYPPTLGNLVDWDKVGGFEQPAAQKPEDAGFMPPAENDNIPF